MPTKNESCSEPGQQSVSFEVRERIPPQTRRGQARQRRGGGEAVAEARKQQAWRRRGRERRLGLGHTRVGP